MAKLKRRADGRFQKRVKVGTDGKRAVYKTVYGATIKETEQKAEALASALNIDKKTTFREWAERWFSVYQADKAYNTRKQYRRMLDGYILPVLGEMALEDIKPADVREMVNGLSARGVAVTAGLALLVVKQALGAAVENDMAEKNAAAAVKPPKAVKTAKAALNKTERGLVMDAATPRTFDKYDAFLFLLFFTGARRGEALALTVGDADLTARTITINKTVIFCPNEAVIKPSPKMAAGTREIPMAATLFDVLNSYAARLPCEPAAPLFPGKNGGFMSLSAFRAFWRQCLNQFSLSESVTPHKFRHNFATELFYASIDIKEAQRLMGHAGTELMLDVYTHSRAEKGDTAAKLDSISR